MDTAPKNKLDTIAYLLSAEFLLKHRSNGGGIVLSRSLLVSFWLYLAAVALKSFTGKYAIFSFSAAELALAINETIPWAGAIFAGTYAALYTRYSNQWSYLASTYNQIKTAKVSLSANQVEANHELIYWQAGFVSDAFTLHLDRKEIFEGVIQHLLTDERIKTAILENFSGKELDEFRRRHVPGISPPPSSAG